MLKEHLKILIIDDDNLCNESLKLLLEQILPGKNKIDCIYNGNEAIEKIQKNNYDIVFLDNKLPDKSGLDILKNIKKQKIDTNVIFLTGFSDEKLAVKAMKLGAIDYISKGSLDIDRLIEAINEIILDSCSILDINPEILLQIQNLFIENEEIIPFHKFELNYSKKEPFDIKLLESLDILYKNHYVNKTKIFSTISCPKCNSLPKEQYIICPICGSYELSKGEVIEHNKCKHIDFKSNFLDSNGNFTCPKCGEQLKQIGVDYIKVGVNYSCNNGHIFPYPEHVYRCHDCNTEFTEDESKLLDVYKYRILEEGKTSLLICDTLEEELYGNMALESNSNQIAE